MILDQLRSRLTNDFRRRLQCTLDVIASQGLSKPLRQVELFRIRASTFAAGPVPSPQP